MKLIPEGYGQNLATARQMLCLEQKDVALMVGVERSTYTSWENERRFPTAANRMKLHKAVGVNPLTLALPEAVKA
jgi:transcriptional regulator with XRE-family HTH domain